MSRVKIQGTEYELRFDLGAMEKMDEIFGGGLEGIQQALRKRSLKSTKQIFEIMANSARHYRGQKEDVNADRALRHATIKEIDEMSNAILAAQEESMKTDTVNGAADDEKHDDVLEELEAEDEKNGATGEG